VRDRLAQPLQGQLRRHRLLLLVSPARRSRSRDYRTRGSIPRIQEGSEAEIVTAVGASRARRAGHLAEAR